MFARTDYCRPPGFWSDGGSMKTFGAYPPAFWAGYNQLYDGMAGFYFLKFENSFSKTAA